MKAHDASECVISGGQLLLNDLFFTGASIWCQTANYATPFMTNRESTTQGFMWRKTFEVDVWFFCQNHWTKTVYSKKSFVKGFWRRLLVIPSQLEANVTKIISSKADTIRQIHQSERRFDQRGTVAADRNNNSIFSKRNQYWIPVHTDIYSEFWNC